MSVTGERPLKNLILQIIQRAFSQCSAVKKATVKLSVDNDCIGVIVDRFGRDIFVTKESDTTFGVSVDIMTSKQFYAWVFGLGGKVRIISPQNVVDEFKKQLENVNDSF